MQRHAIATVIIMLAVLFSAAHGVLAPAELGGWILADGLPVRLQVQLHRILGMQ